MSGLPYVLAVLVVSVGLAGTVDAETQAPDVLAFSSADGALAMAAEDGSARLRLASPRTGEVTNHSWSPDGRRIAFSRCRGRNCTRAAVYVVRADGTGERLLASNAGAAVWLSDGRHLLVERADKPGRWIVAVGTGARRTFTAPGLAAAPLSPRLSPDGRWLLHLTMPYGRLLPSPHAPHHARARNWLMLTSLATGRARRVSTVSGWYSIGTAPWAPDGTRFTFTRRAFLQASGGGTHVAAPSRPGSDLVAEGAREAGAWSPDGARLAFNVGGDCKIRAVTVGADSVAEMLPFTGCLPTWRPPTR